MLCFFLGMFSRLLKQIQDGGGMGCWGMLGLMVFLSLFLGGALV